MFQQQQLSADGDCIHGRDWHMKKRNLYATSNPRVARPKPTERTPEPPPITSPKTITPTRSNLREILPYPAYTGQFRAFRCQNSIFVARASGGQRRPPVGVFQSPSGTALPGQAKPKNYRTQDTAAILSMEK